MSSRRRRFHQEVNVGQKQTKTVLIRGSILLIIFSAPPSSSQKMKISTNNSMSTIFGHQDDQSRWLQFHIIAILIHANNSNYIEVVTMASLYLLYLTIKVDTYTKYKHSVLHTDE
mmetsp:Transcript_33625/g.70699  ORF Transcript_33625/g.70699 Transcript_33625/m.70699 type:complete len:115 (-) Transcript_33625:632-976(-)